MSISWLLMGIILSGSIVLSGCDSGSKLTEKKPESSEEKIPQWVLDPYVDNSVIIGSDTTDPTFNVFKDKIDEVNRQRSEAAHKAINSGKCKQVLDVLFMRRESTVNNLKFIVDCNDSQRLELTSKDLASGAQLKTNSEKSLPKSQAMSQCKSMIADGLPDPSLIKYDELLGSAYHSSPGTGGVRMVLDFEVKAGADKTERYRAVCVFDSSGSSDISISMK